MDIKKLLDDLDLVSLDCDYADIRIERVENSNIAITNGDLQNASVSPSLGAALRVLKNGNWANYSTTKLENLRETFESLVSDTALLPKKDKLNWPQREAKHYEVIKYKDNSCMKYSLEEKLAFLRSFEPVLAETENLTGPTLMYKDSYKEKWFKSKDGISYHYDYNSAGLVAVYTLTDGEDRYQDYINLFFQNIENQYDSVAKKLRETISEGQKFIKAPTVTPGKYQVVLDPDITGIFTHESFGHKSEADFMLGDETMKAEWKFGKKVGAEILSIVDDGNAEFTSGDLPVDDDGNPTKKTYLIKDGILTGRLHSTETAIILDEETTGNARALNFEFQPIVRMTNTYIEPGKNTLDELIAKVDDGLFLTGAKHGMGMSTFTIAPKKGYIIKNGKVTDPVKVGVISGNVMETLDLIEAVGNDMKISSSAFGGCGKMEQMPLPVADGGPSLLIKEMTVS